MMYTVDSTRATSATLPNLQCNTKYTISVHARGGQINRTSTPRMVSLPARGKHLLCNLMCVVYLHRSSKVAHGHSSELYCRKYLLE